LASGSQLLDRSPSQPKKPQWYAAHIRSRHEKRVAEQLSERGVSSFLPLYSSARRWSDRIAKVDLPLFPGYLFVHIPLTERLKVLEVPGIVGLVSSRQEPVPLDESEIEILRKGLTSQFKAEPHPYLKVGERVRVIHGPLTGLEGILERKKDSVRVVVSLDLIMRSISVEISALDLEPVRL
jgi:transcriptional antiterminator NusG